LWQKADAAEVAAVTEDMAVVEVTG
jgi:hypothetical protein